MQTICRMKGSLTQSFFIFDSQRFKMARNIFYNLENEEDEMRHQQELEEIIESEFKLIESCKLKELSFILVNQC